MVRAVLAAALLALLGTAATSAKPVYVSNCGSLTQHPTTLILACGDGNFGLRKLSWAHWGAPTATAVGVVEANDCTPNCAAGKFHDYPAQITVGKVSTCGSKRIYLRLTIVFTGKRPSGYRELAKWPFTCAQATYR